MLLTDRDIVQGILKIKGGLKNCGMASLVSPKHRFSLNVVQSLIDDLKPQNYAQVTHQTSRKKWSWSCFIYG